MNINVELANSVYFNQIIGDLSKSNIPEKYLYDLLLQLNFLNGHCCEVGSGYYSILGAMILKELKKKKTTNDL